MGDPSLLRVSWRWFRGVAQRAAATVPAPSDAFYNVFGRCAATACIFELKVRLLADNTPELRKVFNKDLSDVLAALLEHFGPQLLPDERQTLEKCGLIRNKLLHAEFSRTTGQLVALGAELRRGGVIAGDLETGEVHVVAQTSTATGRVYGWLLEATTSGAFEAARRLFFRGIILINWLLVILAGEACEPWAEPKGVQ